MEHIVINGVIWLMMFIAGWACGFVSCLLMEAGLKALRVFCARRKKGILVDRAGQAERRVHQKMRGELS